MLLHVCIGTLEVFSLFDKDEDGMVNVMEIGPMLRSVGFNPSEAEIQRLQDEQNTDNGRPVNVRPSVNCMLSQAVIVSRFTYRLDHIL